MEGLELERKLSELRDKKPVVISDALVKTYRKSCLFKISPEDETKGWLLYSAAGDGKKNFSEIIFTLKEIEPDSRFLVVNANGKTEY